VFVAGGGTLAVVAAFPGDRFKVGVPVLFNGPEFDGKFDDVVPKFKNPALVDALGVTAGGGVMIGLALDFFESCSWRFLVVLWCRCAFNMARTSAMAKNNPAVYFVIFVSALPEPAPNSASVAAPPKAIPAPASFFGNCTRTSKIKNKQFTTRMNVKNPINKLMLLSS